MRRRIWTLLVLAAALLTLAACGKDAAEEAAGGDWRTWQPVQAQAPVRFLMMQFSVSISGRRP